MITTDANLVRKIQVLKQIKPRKDWVILTKSQILDQEPGLIEQISTFLSIPLQYRGPAFVTLVSMAVLIGAFVFAQNTLPGDALYPLKRITERSQAVFVSEEELPRYNLEIANKRLEDLTEIAQTNQVKKLAPALNEFESSVAEAAQNLAKIKEPEKAYVAGKALVKEIQKLEEKKQKIETFGVVVGDAQEVEEALCDFVEREIENLGTLSERQEELLVEAEEYLAEGKCSLAFEKIWLLSYPQE